MKVLIIYVQKRAAATMKNVCDRREILSLGRIGDAVLARGQGEEYVPEPMD
jgi:hypothetical protein